MLGNFSFGDYFKKEAIHFAWEFVTKELGLSKNSLYVSVFEKDDEAADLWHKQESVAKDRIYRFGEKDNFWSMGDTGPCGPCSEIFVDRGEKYGCGKPTCGMGCDCDRYMEIWNLVFMQFNRSADGQMTPLPKPSVDTGAGLERIASILQGVDTNYEIDIFRHIIDETSKLFKTPYDPKSENVASFRVIADHSRATAFLIGDGVLPSNEGRGYVLRRIMRRAIRHGKKLGHNSTFLHQTAGFVVDQMSDAFPDLKEKRSLIQKAVLAEEDQFLKTLERGLALLEEEMTKASAGKTLPGEVAFKLYDTYGFPLDLTRTIAEEKSFAVDEAGFETSMNRQRTESRKHWKGSGEEAIQAAYMKVAEELKAKKQTQKFEGYDSKATTSKCIAILVDQEGQLKKIDSYSTPPLGTQQIIEAVFLETPFYGESGGQVGDRGLIKGKNGFEGEVIDVQKPVPDLTVAHIKPLKGELKINSEYIQETNDELRSHTAKNHTATHLIHWALREVLGSHVKQAGSLVTPDLLRFDFTHFQPMTDEEIQKVEDRVNEKVWGGFPVSKKEMKKDAAIAAGAIAFFGEKYGDSVRVIQVGNFSTELCGGTHVNQSSDIHLFKIANESGIASGVRRIIAYTSKGAFQFLRTKNNEINLIRDKLKASSSAEILTKIEKMAASEKELRNKLGTFQAQQSAGEVDEILKNAKKVGSTVLVTYESPSDPEGAKKLRDLAERIKQKSPNSISVLGMKDNGKAALLVAVGPNAPKTISANELLKDLAPHIEGRGGGKADMAQAGGTNPGGIPTALQKAKDLISKKLDS
jgi:alanyl-tRNA synthetase